MYYIVSLIIRLTLSFILVLIPFNIFQLLFTKITIYIVFFLLKIADTTAVLGKYSVKYAIDIQGVTVNIVPLCVTASAYYLLFLLVFLVKDVKFLSRLKMIFLGIFFIFLMNLVRIIILIWVLINKGDLFANLHTFLWFILSTVYVIALWLFFSYIYEIKTIPIYSDIKYLLSSKNIKGNNP